MKHTLSRLRSYFWFTPLVWSYTAVLGVLSLLSSFFDKDGHIQHVFARLWSRMILATVLSRVTIEGLERLPAGAAVWAVNHASALDIPVIYANLPRQFRIMAKKELFRYPFMGWHLQRSGQIAIDRDDARASVRSLARAADSLRSGMPLMVFPEGGRSLDGCIQPFLGGAFLAAIRAGVPVVPMVIVGAFEILPMNSYHLQPGPVQLVIGEPIPPEGYKPRDMDAFADRVRSAIEDMYYARAKVMRPQAQASPAQEQAPGSAV